MANDVQEFLHQLLTQAECRNVHISGTNLAAQCPFHRPKHNTSAFNVNFVKEERGFPYRCWSCGEVGNIFQLIMHLHGCSYSKAEKLFLKKVALSPITLEYLTKSYDDMFRKVDNYIKNKVVTLPAKFSKKPMLRYLNERNEREHHGIMNIDYIVNLYNLYYCESGRYRERVIMPIRDIYGRKVYFTNRSINPEVRAKNLFPFESDATNHLFGLFESIGKKKVMVVEGPFEVFQLKSFAMKHKYQDWGFVALMGHEVGDVRAGLITDCFEEAYVCLDHEDDVIENDFDVKATEFLNEYLPTENLTRLLYKGKEPGNCTEEQLHVLFRNAKRAKSLNRYLVDWGKKHGAD